MDKKVLVEVLVPAAGKAYDVYIPLESRLYEVIGVLSKLITDLAEGSYRALEGTVLCDREANIVYNMNLRVEELGIHNGSRLMLI